MSLDLPRGDIHVYFSFPDQINDETLLTKYRYFLSKEEKEQWQRFHFAQHQHQYLVTRALIRTTLSLYTNKDPSDWCFSLNNYGKPEIKRKPRDPHIRFNLSHTDGLIMCAVMLENDIGVDVENRERNNELKKIADRYFSSQEICTLHQAPKNLQKHLFFEYWTLKESYIKARGMGLSIPLDQFSFDITSKEKEGVKISFDPQFNDNPHHWRFLRFKPSHQHLAALAIKSKTNLRFNVITKKVVPLKSIKLFKLPFS